MYYAGYFENLSSTTGFPKTGPATAAKHDGIFGIGSTGHVFEGLDYACCRHCGKYSLWYEQKLIVPPVLALGPEPSEDLPEDIKTDFNEARSIGTQSPRGAAALLRLCVQKLCAHLGEEAKNLNDAIQNLIKKGLDAQISDALHAVRVIGNAAVHPLKLDLRDDVATVEQLFELINFIVDSMITQPKRRQKLFDSLTSKRREEGDDKDPK